jgi:hypothetical protein
MRALGLALLATLFFAACSGGKGEQDAADTWGEDLRLMVDSREVPVPYPIDLKVETLPADVGSDGGDAPMTDVGLEVDSYDGSNTTDSTDFRDAGDGEVEADTQELVDIAVNDLAKIPDLPDAADLGETWDMVETFPLDLSPETKDSWEQWDVCEPACEGMECGDDGCGSKCGYCGYGRDCIEGECIQVLYCGDDLCDPKMGEHCANCVEDCACVVGTICFAEECCTQKQCGLDDCDVFDDGCGGTVDCAGCPLSLVCYENQCCLPFSCGAEKCGVFDDGCGGTMNCGGCADSEVCSGGECVCQPVCEPLSCGDNGCGGNCSCPAGKGCIDEECVTKIPTIKITSPSTHTYFNLQPGGTEVIIEYEVFFWPGWDASKGVLCYIDGEEVSLGDVESCAISDYPLGMHTVTAQLALEGAPLSNCSANSSIIVKVKKSCDGFDDLDCNDGNPCSIDACTFSTEGYMCHYGLDLEQPWCCNSKFDCDCYDGIWDYCSEVTHNC